MGYTLFVDSDCDMTPELCEKYGAKMILMPYTVGETLITPYKDFDVFDAHAYYDMLRQGTMPTTSAISAETYKEYFEPEFAAGKDIFYVHFSAAMTNTFDFMNQALTELKAQYPERKFYEIDTKGITFGGLEVVLEVCEKLKAGATPEELVEWAKTEIDHYAVYFTCDDLKFFHRSGRVSGLSATMGSLLGIRPILCMNAEGKMESIGTEKGRKKALRRLVNTMKEIGDDIKNHTIVMGSADSPQLVNELTAMIREEFGDDIKITYTEVNPTAGAHCGPDGVAIAFHSLRR